MKTKTSEDIPFLFSLHPAPTSYLPIYEAWQRGSLSEEGVMEFRQMILTDIEAYFALLYKNLQMEGKSDEITKISQLLTNAQKQMRKEAESSEEKERSEELKQQLLKL